MADKLDKVIADYVNGRIDAKIKSIESRYLYRQKVDNLGIRTSYSGGSEQESYVINKEELENRSPKSPVISDMPRGGQKRPDSAYENLVNIISQTYQIEQCVDRCEPQACIVLRQKYFSETEYPQWKLAELAGYSRSRYNDFLRQALLQFATAYRII